MPAIVHDRRVQMVAKLRREARPSLLPLLHILVPRLLVSGIVPRALGRSRNVADTATNGSSRTSVSLAQ